jgi:hypothetical protein
LTTFIALYRGETVSSAKIVAVSADTDLVADFAARMLHREEETEDDPVVHSLDVGRREALRLISEEARERQPPRATSKGPQRGQRPKSDRA